MTEPLVSIIIPVFNTEKYIAATLDSVLSQKYTNIEIIVVNDGSTDNTLFIINEYAQKDNRIKVLSKNNGGVTSARLFGLMNANGEYIGFVDGDDNIEPDMYQRLVENAIKYNADISHCGYQMVFPSRTDYYYNTEIIFEQDTTKGLLDLLAGKIIEPGVVNKIYRRYLFCGIENVLDSSVKINEDLLMNYYLFKQSSQSIFEDVCKYHYMVRNGSAATAQMNANKLRDPVTVARIIYNDCQTNMDLYPTASRLYSEKLIIAATAQLHKQQLNLKMIQKEIRIELRTSFLRLIKQQNKYHVIKIIFAAFLPSIYGYIHTLYSKINGNSQKYATE